MPLTKTAEILQQLSPNDRFAINANWLMTLRWVAVAGQLTTIAIVDLVLRIPVRILPLLVALAVTTATNLVFTFWLNSLRRRDAELPTPRLWNRVFLSLMVLDLLVLSLLLYFTGGHSNPFSVFFFVNLALSGILLPPGRAWLLTALSVFCFAGLFYYQVPLEQLQQPESLRSIRENGVSTVGHRGLYAAFTACSVVIVYFVTRLNTELRSRDEALRQAQLLQARSERWEALGTLSAGAAHELATPLTTIAIVSKEMERELTKLISPEAKNADTITGDVNVIRREVDRCRTILDRMSIDAGHATAEADTTIDAGSLLETALKDMAESKHRLRVWFVKEANQSRVRIPLHSVCQALRGVVQNALDASTDEVSVAISDVGDFLQIAVTDRGSGMTAEVLQRADEPFFTTKDAGKGMGLGRFLARTVFERVGGGFETESTVDVGTTVTVRIPTTEKNA